MEHRPLGKELTREERAQIRKLVRENCANYSKDYKECLPLETECYMFGKRFAGGVLCRYFEQAVLPLSPALEQLLTGQTVKTKNCPVCGAHFAPDKNRVYCDADCKQKAIRQKDRERKRRLK